MAGEGPSPLRAPDDPASAEQAARTNPPVRAVVRWLREEMPSLGIMRREAETVYIAYIEISARMVEKLGSDHGVTEDEVRDTFQLPGKPQRGVWYDDPEHGRRLYVRGRTPEGRRIVAILRQVDRHNDHWRLRTAWHVNERRS
jgi:hypothetical protein